MMIDTRQAALLLGGDVCGRDQVVCPGPGHSHRDRSLSVRFISTAQDGFVVHSFSGDDPIAARDHVRERLGLPRWEPGDGLDRQTSHPQRFDQMAIDREAEPRFGQRMTFSALPAPTSYGAKELSLAARQPSSTLPPAP
jgi:putative DNA primase/helicase